MSDFGEEERDLLVRTHTLLETYVATSTKILDDHETRIRTVEKKQTGILATLALLLSGAGATATQYWHKIIG